MKKKTKLFLIYYYYILNINIYLLYINKLLYNIVQGERGWVMWIYKKWGKSTPNKKSKLKLFANNFYPENRRETSEKYH